jgi:hypothetical protein
MGNGPSWGRRWVVQQLALEHTRKRREAFALACRDWNLRLHHGGTLRPSPTIGEAIEAGYSFLRIACTNCRRRAFVALTSMRRPTSTYLWKLEDSLACSHCRERVNFPPRARIERLTRDTSDLGWVDR